MREIETEMKTRVRGGGRDEDRVTGNLVYAAFTHNTSRPVDGVEDPHLHTHCYVFNTTWDAAEQRYKAVQVGDLKRDATYYEAAFEARLAGRLKALGYDIEHTPKGWEIAGLEKRELINKFARRTEIIEQQASAKGIRTDALKEKLGAESRERKREGLNYEELRQTWWERLNPEERKAMRQIMSLNKPKAVDKGITAEHALSYALDTSLERQSAVQDKRLKAEALKYGVGYVSVEQIQETVSRFQAQERILQRNKGTQSFITTKAVLQEEQAMIAFAREGQNSSFPLNREWQSYEFHYDYLNTEQRQAVKHVLSSYNRVMAISGGAGTGKSTLAKEAKRGIEQGGKQVFAFAPTTGGRDVLREDGFASAETIARLRVDQTLQTQLKDQVIWIDEAGLLGAKDMHAVFTIAKAQHARVVLSGDTAQHTAVARGDAMRVLETYAGLTPARVSEIQRQKPNQAYKEAVWYLSQGEDICAYLGEDRVAFDVGFEKLAADGRRSAR